MEFDEMKKIWDAQNNENVYAINEKALHKRIHKKRNAILRIASFDEWGLILISLGLAVFKITRAIQFDATHKIFQGIIFIIVAGYIYWDRRRRLKEQGQSDSTLLGDIEQAMRSITHQIKRQRNFIWWFLMPVAITAVIEQTNSWESDSWQDVLLILGSFLLSYIVVEIGLRKGMYPRKKDFESARNLLLEEK